MTPDTNTDECDPAMLALVRRVVEEFAGALTVDAFTPQARLVDLGIRSLLLFPFISRLEELGGVTIADSDFHSTNFMTVGSVCAVLSAQLPPSNPLQDGLQESEQVRYVR
jgi:acyl carrier protein